MSEDFIELEEKGKVTAIKPSHLVALLISEGGTVKDCTQIPIEIVRISALRSWRRSLRQTWTALRYRIMPHPLWRPEFDYVIESPNALQQGDYIRFNDQCFSGKSILKYLFPQPKKGLNLILPLDYQKFLQQGVEKMRIITEYNIMRKPVDHREDSFPYETRRRL